MGDGELIDHRDPEPGLDQRADRGAKPRPDRDVVAEFIAGEDFGHDAAIGVVGIDADQGIADDFRRRDLLAAGQLVAIGDDAEQFTRGQRQEVEAGMIEPVAHGDAIAPAEQEIIDGLLDFQDIDVDAQFRIAPPHPLDGAGYHDLRNARHRADAQFRQRAAANLGDDLGEIVDLLVDAVDLLENILRLRGRKIASVLTLEESDAE